MRDVRVGYKYSVRLDIVLPAAANVLRIPLKRKAQLVALVDMRGVCFVLSSESGKACGNDRHRGVSRVLQYPIVPFFVEFFVVYFRHFVRSLGYSDEV